MRNAPDLRGTLLEFLQSAYNPGASTADWNANDLLSSWGREEVVRRRRTA